ncbi:ABC transporter substrate-binding protein [Clostridium sp. CS001]|uniref:ABC transporter substrate-binding protein n=1 Tax=Clostridium sp. CS001 TaxID=2880648 RepID=UPI001CF2549C|nr:ABC transporter substrate-binding protein [Clostridium sp. CS001]MCB2290934.1 ABC transporter substrate-binding protein [Clostridium sp. CS001]
MKKKLSIILSVLFAMSAFTACGAKKEETKKEVKPEVKQEQKVEAKSLKVFYPDGIPALTIAKLVKENPSINKNITISYELQKTPDALVSKVLSGEADIAIVPSNLAAQAYNKNMPYKLAATGGWGSFFLISTEDIKAFNDIKGKEIHNIGKGLTPDIVFKYILSKNSINPDKDVTITYLNSATELAPTFISGKSKIAVIPEPMLTNVTMKKPDIKIIFNLNEEWTKITGNANGYPQSSLIIKKDLLENNKEFVEEFLVKYKESIEWANKNPEKLGEYAQELKFSMTKEIVQKSITRANIKYVDIKDSIKDYEVYFKALFEFESKSIGGKLPDEGLYMQK